MLYLPPREYTAYLNKKTPGLKSILSTENVSFVFWTILFIFLESVKLSSFLKISKYYCECPRSHIVLLPTLQISTT
jgi:hypothetical protein